MSKRKAPDDNIIRQLYLKDMWSSGDIAKRYKVARVSICRHLKRLGITRPESGETSRNRKYNVKVFRSGYPVTFKPRHPRRNNLGYVFDHVLAWEKKWGVVPSREQPIHHIDLDRKNSDVKNLYMFANHKQHQEAHRSLEKVSQELVKKGVIGFAVGRYFIKK